MSSSRTPAIAAPALCPEASRTAPDGSSEVAGDSVTASLAGHIHHVLGALGEDPEREGLRKTPERVARAYRFLTSGAAVDPHELLRPALTSAVSQEMVLVRGVEYYALCERHLLPFFGRAHVAYFPGGSTVGVGTIVRLIDVLARRPQTQEQLTRRIQGTLEEVLVPRGVAVLLEARHTALLMQGPEKQHAELITYASSGAFRQPEHQATFARLIRGRSAGIR